MGRGRAVQEHLGEEESLMLECGSLARISLVSHQLRWRGSGAAPRVQIGPVGFLRDGGTAPGCLSWWGIRAPHTLTWSCVTGCFALWSEPHVMRAVEGGWPWRLVGLPLSAAHPGSVSGWKPGSPPPPPPHLCRNHFSPSLCPSGIRSRFSTSPQSRFVFAVGCVRGNAGSLARVAPLWFALLPTETVFGFTFHTRMGIVQLCGLFQSPLFPSPTPIPHPPFFPGLFQ